MADGVELAGWARAALRCPVTHTELVTEDGPEGTRLVNTSAERRLAYPVREGVPVLLPSEAIPLDSPAS